MLLVDTNVLVYAADADCEEHRKCRALLDSHRRSAMPCYVTWGIVYEFLRVVTHPKVFRSPWRVADAWGFVEALLGSDGVSVLSHTSRHSAVAAATLAELPALRGNLVHDAHTAIVMREHGIRRICTRDTDFHRFPFLEVIDPLA